jgi:hypothetical protein
VTSYVLIYDKQRNHYKMLFAVYGDPRSLRATSARGVWLGDSVINHTSGQAAVSVLSRVVFPPSVPEDVFQVARLLERRR